MALAGERTVLVIENSPTSGLGRFEQWWSEAGLTLDIVTAPTRPLPGLDGYAALVMLGGGFMPDAIERAPWLGRERELAVEAVESGLPTLGICLGGQLLAQVFHGFVESRSGEPESGSTRLTVLDTAGDDSLFAALPRSVTAIEHHEDAITRLPPGAVLLASSERCKNQAFRLGERAWGLQFHPESSAERVRGWDRAALAAQGFDPDAVVSTADRDEPDSMPVWRDFAARFAGLVIARSAPSQQERATA